jgi:hypothetical protein
MDRMGKRFPVNQARSYSVNRWVREELEPAQHERDLSRSQRVRRWLEHRLR